MSETSPTDGDAPDPVDAKAGDGKAGDAKPDAKSADKPRSERSRRTEIELEVARGRSVGWTIFGLIFGVLLIWQLGTVGVWAGIALVVTGAFHAWKMTQTLLYPPGTIVVTDREVSLPRGLCKPRPIATKPADVTAVYFLRRSVPWNHAAPVLVIELGNKAMLYPRDWFASEADQRHIVHALLRAKSGAADKPAADKPSADKPADDAPAP